MWYSKKGKERAECVRSGDGPACLGGRPRIAEEQGHYRPCWRLDLLARGIQVGVHGDDLLQE